MSIAPPSTVGGNRVPLSHLPALLGDRNETLLASTRLADEAAWTDGFRLAGTAVNVSTHDEIRIAVVATDGDLVEQWVLDVDDWRILPEQGPGDDLSVAGRSKRVISETGTIRIGRSGGNRVLVQRGTFTTALTNFNLNVYARSYDGGLLERRVSSTRSNAPRDVVFKIRSATGTPAAPTGVTFAADGTATPGSDGYVLVTDPDPPGTDPLYIASAHNPYNYVTETYQPEAWVITLGGSAYRQEWADDELGPWLPSPATLTNALRLITRVRVNGVWETFVVRDDTPQAWVWFVVARLAANSSPHILTLNPSNWEDFKFIEFIMRQRNGATSGNRRSVIVPADHVTSMGDAVDLTSRYILNLLLGETVQSWTQGATDRFATLVTPNLDTQSLRVFVYGDEAARSHGTNLRVDVGFNDHDVDFVMRGIR